MKGIFSTILHLSRKFLFKIICIRKCSNDIRKWITLCDTSMLLRKIDEFKK